MNTPQQELGSALLGQLPLAADLPKLRADALDAITKETRRLKRQRIAVQAFWIFCAVLTTVYMWFGPDSMRIARAPFLACFFFLWGGIELLKSRIHCARVEVLAEVKFLQLQIAELSGKIDTRK